MDNSRMAKANTTINYNLNKGGRNHDQMSRPVEQCCGDYCCCEKCTCEDGKSLDDALNPPIDDDCGHPICC